MSRLSEIIDNHDKLNRLYSILKHYGVSAQFVTTSVIEKFESIADEEQNNEMDTTDLLEDLKLFCAGL